MISATMTASLPAFTDYEALRIWRADPAQWLPIAHDIARSHGLTCAAPHVFSTGTNLVITRLSGVLGAAAWPSLPKGDKERVLAEIGETIAEVQRVPAGPLAQIEPSWDAFMRGQIEGCRARHERLGLPQKFLDGLDELLRDAAAML